MRIGIPHLGNACIMVRAIAARLGAVNGEGLVIPPPMTKKTLDLGVKYSPAEACLPYKLTLGSLIEACELGADTLIQARGTGICRLGYYAKGQEQMLHDLGYDAHFLTLDISHHKFLNMLRLIRSVANGNRARISLHGITSAFFFGIWKMIALDKVEKVAQNVMASTKEDIPVLAVACDEQMGREGMLTRVEAFVDLLEFRRRKRDGRKVFSVG